MSKFWHRIFALDYELSIWVEEEELGKDKIICHRHKNFAVKIPQRIDKKITLRLRGLGKTRLRKTGDLFLHLWLNKGEDVSKVLWLSEASARIGEDKKLCLGEKTVTVIVPSKSYDGLTIRLRGLGRRPESNQFAPPLNQKKNGDLLVKLCVYPDNITPVYGSFNALSTENMALEGWVYRKLDEVISKIGKPNLPSCSIQARAICDLFNEKGWSSIFHALVDHLNLTHLLIEFAASYTINLPGSCKRTAVLDNNRFTGYKYKITIKDQFLDNPFSVAAILAHELCHVVYTERIDGAPKAVGYVLKSEKATLEEERTVDLLVFLYKIGEFQLRVARDKRLTLGYFDQEVFERMQVIVTRKASQF